MNPYSGREQLSLPIAATVALVQAGVHRTRLGRDDILEWSYPPNAGGIPRLFGEVYLGLSMKNDTSRRSEEKRRA